MLSKIIALILVWVKFWFSFTEVISLWRKLQTEAIEKERHIQAAADRWNTVLQKIDELETWISYAQDLRESWTKPPGDVEKLECLIKDHKVR